MPPVRSSLALTLLAALAGGAAAAQEPPAAGEPLDAAARRLSAGLTAEASKARQQAEDGLVELGEAARPILQDLLGRTQDAEARSRLESALQRIAAGRKTGASFVTLRLKDATAAEAFSELTRQAFAPLRPYPEDLWEDGNLPRLTLDIERKPFWDAARELAQRTGVSLQPWSDGLRVVRGPGGGELSGPGVVQGPFLVVATQVNHSRTIVLGAAEGRGEGRARPPMVRNNSDEFGVHLLVVPEPKLTVLRLGSALTLERAVDDAGNDLAPPNPAARQPHTGGNSPSGWRLYARLHYPEKPGKTIARLAGRASFVVQTTSQTIEIADPLTLKEVTRDVAGSRVTLHELAKRGGEGRYELRATLSTPTTAAAADPAGGAFVLIQSIQSGLRLLTTDGFPLDRRGFSSEGNGRQTTLTLHFARRGGMGPAKLVWEVPTGSEELAVPFEFKDLPMP